MSSGRGGGRTPSVLVDLLQKAISTKGQYVVEAETGLSHSMISRYKRGIGEPSTATLEKFSKYFKVPVVTLRGEENHNIFAFKLMKSLMIGQPKEKTLDIFRNYGFDNKSSNDAYKEIIDEIPNYFNSSLFKNFENTVNTLLLECEDKLLNFSPSELVVAHRTLEQLANNNDFYTSVVKLLSEYPQSDPHNPLFELLNQQ
jgi:transcriptional regulator with XRE-family HTH domain